MTSKGDNLKTNEFLRLRKLRLQQVREQSKDIAKKIRKRAKVEQLRYVTNVDSNKEKIYLQRQEQLVNRLEQLYSKRLENVGAGHKNASEVNLKDTPEKKDLSKLRGKEAVAELRRKKQEKLDEQKKFLDRKLKAREAANEISREKSVNLANILMKSSSSKDINDANDKNTNSIEKMASEVNINTEKTHQDKPDALTKNDMATQWESEQTDNGWQPHIPTLSIPNDDTAKNGSNDNVEKSDKSKRLNLFALSDEMPSSLRGGITSIPDDRVPMKPSLTLVSEYLHTRQLRLREPDTTIQQKQKPDELMSIKQTLLKMRASRTDGSVFPNICHVLDEQVIPVPHWRAEINRELCSHKSDLVYQNYQYKSNKFSINKYPTLRSGLKNVTLSFDRCELCTWTPHRQYHPKPKIPVSGRSNNIDRSSKSVDHNMALGKKNSVTMYDHNTRDTRDVPHNLDRAVVREHNTDNDAYSQALKETSTIDNTDKIHHKAQQEARSGIAISKQNVDKEYRDTLAFLNSLPKEKPTRSMRTAFMDDERMQEVNNKRQQQLQQEYKKIERDCRKHCKHSKCRTSVRDQNRSKSKSPTVNGLDENTVNREFQYSWLPVPESDGSLAIHSIPNACTEKPGNTVKFSSVDTYHEYRSRHKHTPPTKDNSNEVHKRHVETVIIQENSNESLDSSGDTDTSSVENLRVKPDSGGKRKSAKDVTHDDAERIIIYKVIESKKGKNHKVKKKSVLKSKLNGKDDDITVDVHRQKTQDTPNKSNTDPVNINNVSVAEVKEGVYQSVSANGDNITSMYFTEDQRERRKQQVCKNLNSDKRSQCPDNAATKSNEDISLNRTAKSSENCKCQTTVCDQQSHNYPSAATSTSSFKTALNEKADSAQTDGGYIKFVDDGGQDAGKFYVGASGFLKDSAYEVVIQLRKKEQEKVTIVTSRPAEKNIEKVKLDEHPIAVQTIDTQISSPKISDANIQQKSSPKENLPTSHTEMNTAQQQTRPDEENRRITQIESHKHVNQETSKVESPKEIEKADKASATSFRDTFAIPDNVPKSDPIPRPAMSTYTQTSHSSPIPRPVLLHLSSSTSTTYMSPPDVVLPRYFRQSCSESHDESYERHLSKRFESFSDRAYRYGKRDKHAKVRADTPPNSTRSTDQATDAIRSQQYQFDYSENEQRDKKVRPHKCKSHSDHKICSKQKCKRSSRENKRIRTESNSTLSNKKRKIINNSEGTKLNPVIEDYVKKLLALNKEGLKAMDVVTQECSGVPTPGSSIIEVPSNVNKNKLSATSKISLEQIKNSLIEKILKNSEKRESRSQCNIISTGSQTERLLKPIYKYSRKRRVHKVKSLNISKQFMKTSENRRQSTRSTTVTTSPVYVSSRIGKHHQKHLSVERSNSDHNDLPSQRLIRNNVESKNSSSDINKYSNKASQQESNIRSNQAVNQIHTGGSKYGNKPNVRCGRDSYMFHAQRATNTNGHSSESETSNAKLNRRNFSTPPISISTQTNNVDSEVEFMKLAESKLQNMEKIADLTDKCTQRLSNLAKVLEEVRKNKSLAYSQISTSTSDSASSLDQKSDKNAQANDNRVHNFNPTVDIKTLTEPLSPLSTTPNGQKVLDISSAAYVPILLDIPKPDSYRTPSPVSYSARSEKSDNDVLPQQQSVKNRGKPPPALRRVNLKHVPDDLVIPHELSTVVEVDSPMSVKLKNHTHLDNKHDVSNAASIEDSNSKNKKENTKGEAEIQNVSANDTRIGKINMSKGNYKPSDSSDESKLKMMDLKQFNEVMLKPFVTLQDYAKQYNIEELDDGSILTRISKDEYFNEELSSLHSEASLPDIMAELLKRNLISEPLKFERTSNANSSTISSDSTLSMLALSQAQKDKNKSGILLTNKNIIETSESLSISSNPDLEHAFQRLGMGWASSTLKKTKERLALSSSSNTSSSSMPQFKIKSFDNQDVPELSKESILSLLNISNKKEAMKPVGGNTNEPAKNVLQQTSLTNSMTVKEFLANELAKKITFSNKSNRNTTEDEFISLCETKMPEEMRHMSHKIEEIDKSVDNATSGNNNRARTSTPVQIYKSMTYRSTSSSNTSNGLFSNAEELSSVKVTSNSHKNHSTSDKDDLTIPNYSLKMRKGLGDYSKSD